MTSSSFQLYEESIDSVDLEIRGFDPVTGEETIEYEQQLYSELAALGLETDSFEGIVELLDSIGTPENLVSDVLNAQDDSSQTESVIDLDSVFGDDQRTLVSDTTSDPFSRIGFIRMEFPNGSWYGGSGAMISPYHFLTAGHNIYSSEDGGWAEQAYVTLAQDGTERPYGEAGVTYFHSVTGWTEDENQDYDWAIVTLDRNLGNFSGWMGMRSENDSYFDNLNVTTAGYPGDLASGLNSFSTGGQSVEMYQASGPIQTTSTHQLFYNDTIDTFAGQSGSPVWVNDAGSPYVVGVHAYGKGDNDYNEATRMQSYMIDLYRDWQSTDDAVRAPIDQPDLVDYDTWMDTDFAYLSSNSVSPGENFEIRSVVRNNGTAASGNFSVNFYASTDDDVTDSFGSHYLIGTSNLSSINPFDWQDAIWNNTFPDIPDDSYSVIAYIDPSNSIDEFDDSAESNQVVIDELSVVTTDDNYEPNNTLQTAYDMTSQEQTWLSSIDGSGVANDHDWYEIEVLPGEEDLVVDLQFTHADGDIDLALYNASGTEIDYSTSATDNESINLTVDPGTYYLQVYPYQDDDAGNTYDLWWGAFEQEDNYELNNTLETAYDITGDEQIWLEDIYGLGVANNEDWYKLETGSGFENLMISLQFTHADGDIDMALYDELGNYITGAASTTDNEQINVAAPAGIYYLQVYPFSGSLNAGNTYDLWWDDVATL